ncbi:MAG TPA: Zn-ribbon domain-containing OB-fold protein [Syntrophomonadaceae bacterium]|nr:Zn-ribbon domain-containing OB-fold protein [Syntrophomonadaceae bacterium]HPU49080.1 Zn-ribbon domain-containing OB-fold protein [Syntrophomonadaceae bacterium]
MEYRLPFKEYNKALRKGKLLGLRCNSCGAITCPPKMSCQECSGLDLEIVELSGKGSIVTFTTSYVAPQGRENELPFTIVMVQLDEGPWIMGNLIDMEPEKITFDIIGRRVKLGSRVYPGDMFSGGALARPVFSFDD